MTATGAPYADACSTEEAVRRVQRGVQAFLDNVGLVLVGRRETVTLLMVALLCEGHVLLEDVPGMGKTLLAKTAARSLQCGFRRIQFTPDLMPSDVTGLRYYNQKSGDFVLLPGPIMANVVLADEINRATPRTQSCLLEAMQERQVTIDNETLPLPRPFLVLATQNPVEQEGTFPLPEAQLDRFLLRLSQGYPSLEEELAIVERFESRDPLVELQPVMSAQDLGELAGLCRRVMVERSLRRYMLEVVRATREHELVRLGASPRASQALFWSAQALAAVQGRAYVLPDDVKRLAEPVLAHRLVLMPEARLGGVDKARIIAEILEKVPVPVT